MYLVTDPGIIRNYTTYFALHIASTPVLAALWLYFTTAKVSPRDEIYSLSTKKQLDSSQKYYDFRCIKFVHLTTTVQPGLMDIFQQDMHMAPLYNLKASYDELRVLVKCVDRFILNSLIQQILPHQSTFRTIRSNYSVTTGHSFTQLTRDVSCKNLYQICHRSYKGYFGKCKKPYDTKMHT